MRGFMLYRGAFCLVRFALHICVQDQIRCFKIEICVIEEHFALYLCSWPNQIFQNQKLCHRGAFCLARPGWRRCVSLSGKPILVKPQERRFVCLLLLWFLSVCLCVCLFVLDASGKILFFLLLHILDSGYISSPQVARRTSSLARRHQRGFQIQKLVEMKMLLIVISKFDDGVDDCDVSNTWDGSLVRSGHVAPKSSGEKSGRAACWHSGGQ